AVIVSNQGCADTSECITIEMVSLEKESLNTPILLVPNPTNSKTIVQTDLDVLNIRVVDLSGRLLDIDYNLSEKIIYFENVPKGNYFIEIKTEYGTTIKKLIVN
ncbi:MAG: T9SS type A sorting domain-containing protein, partial [Brumimicrobium sp.]